MRNITKRLLAFILSVAMILGIVPMTAMEAYADELVYLSVSNEGVYIEDSSDTNTMCCVPVSLSALKNIDLNNYTAIDKDTFESVNMSKYICDKNGDGVQDITVLHLYIYAHENIYGGDWSEVYLGGDPGSIFFTSGIFGFIDCNLNYYVNGEYPLAYAGWGATADICILNAGDFVDIASYSDWNAWSDSNGGFKYFANDESMSHEFYAKTNEVFSVELLKRYAYMMGDCSTNTTSCSTTKVYYGKTAFEDSQYVTTNEDGVANITFTEPGTWYLWSYGDEGLDMAVGSCVSSPAYAVVTVEADEEPEPEPNSAPTLKKIIFQEKELLR